MRVIHIYSPTSCMCVINDDTELQCDISIASTSGCELHIKLLPYFLISIHLFWEFTLARLLLVQVLPFSIVFIAIGISWRIFTEFDEYLNQLYRWGLRFSSTPILWWLGMLEIIDLEPWKLSWMFNIMGYYNTEVCWTCILLTLVSLYTWFPFPVIGF